MSDQITGQLLQPNRMNICGIANRLCPLKPLLNGQNHPNLTQ